MIKIISTSNFFKVSKSFLKKYTSFKNDLKVLENTLKNNPAAGESYLGQCRKIRIQIAAKGKGKSGGARIVYIYVRFKKTIFLLDILDKSQYPSFSKEREKNIKIMIDKIQGNEDIGNSH